MKKYWWLRLSILVILGGMACTENPFFKEDTIKRKTIRGQVVLVDHPDPSEVFVWFKACEISTRTDKNGAFELVLPLPSKQPGGGLNGVYPIYFYISNYYFVSKEIYLLNGEVEYSKGSLNAQGEISEPVRLTPLIDLQFAFDKTQVVTNQSDTITVSMSVSALDDTIPSIIHVGAARYKGDIKLLAGFMRQLNVDSPVIKRIIMADRRYGVAEFNIVTILTTINSLLIDYQPGMLPPGQYEIIPGIFVMEPGLPEGLRANFNFDPYVFDENFLVLPFKLKNNRFQVLASE
ncbi:hypothetical protein L0128_21185 [candidate division KSB1 bacterium]|nr:hypothetical protein [candidate division KSB1 bacterium]